MRYSSDCAQYSDSQGRVQPQTQSYWNKATLLLSWSHRYKNDTSGWPLRNNQYLKWQWIFYLLRRSFSFLYHCQYFDRTWLYMSNTTDVLCEAGTAYPLRAPEFTRDFLVGFVLLIILVLLLSYYVCFRVVMSPLWFPHTNDVRFVFTSRCL